MWACLCQGHVGEIKSYLVNSINHRHCPARLISLTVTQCLTIDVQCLTIDIQFCCKTSRFCHVYYRGECGLIPEAVASLHVDVATDISPRLEPRSACQHVQTGVHSTQPLSVIKLRHSDALRNEF